MAECARGWFGHGGPITLIWALAPAFGARVPESILTWMSEVAVSVDGRVKQAGLCVERAVFTGDAEPLAEADRGLDAAEADLAVVRGRLMHTRFLLRREEDPAAAEEDPGELPLFERAAQLYRALGDVRGEAEALFWAACFHQVVRHDNTTAVPGLEQSLKLAAQMGGPRPVS